MQISQNQKGEKNPQHNEIRDSTPVFQRQKAEHNT